MTKKKKKTTSKPKGRGRSRSRSRNDSVNVKSVAAPNRELVLLKYSEILSLTTVGAFNTYQFNLNGLFDPNYTGSGHQPSGYDNLTAVYNRYRVVKCHYKVMFSTTSTLTGIKLCCVPSTVTTAFTNINFPSEQKWSRTGIVGVASGLNTTTISGTIDLSALSYGSYREFESSSTSSSLVSSNPGDTAILNICWGSLDSTSGITMGISVDLTYSCQFYDRYNAISSLSHPQLPPAPVRPKSFTRSASPFEELKLDGTLVTKTPVTS